MTNKRKIISFFLFFSCIPFFAAEKAKPVCERAEKLLYLGNKLHYQAPVFDTAFCRRVIRSYVFNLDPQSWYLLDNDIKALEVIQKTETIPENIFCRSHDYIAGIYQKRVMQTDSILTACLSKKYTWLKNDTLIIRQKYSDLYPKNTIQKAAHIDKWIKLSMLHELDFSGKLEKDYEFEKNGELKVKTITRLKKNISKIINNLNTTDASIENDLLQAIAAAFDPHSDYLTPKEKTNLNNMLSTTVEVYGFAVGESENGHIEITSVKPGSPAWKSNNINKGDQVREVKFKNKSAIDVTDYDVDEFNYMMTRSNEKEMDISLLKKNGSVVKAHLAKAAMQSEENVINSYILSKTKPIGYIPLPSFYTDLSAYTASGCANDVAKEIVKLKTENIEGLILDLRNNGGGSVEEAINLAGIFIDAAPLFIAKMKFKKPHVMKDMNRGSIYDGPLLILINTISASASEMLAKMLQDQQRAIIAGSNSYGKASAQIVVPLDTSCGITINKKYYDEKDGYFKVTVEKFYDVTGSTYQNKGVEPHIHLPDLWYKLPVGEKEYEHTLANDTIDKRIKLDVWPDDKINTCYQLSSKRVSRDFKRVVALADTCRALYNDYPYFPLTPSEYKKRGDMRARFDSISNCIMYSMDTTFKVTPNKHTAEIMQMDEFVQFQITEQVDKLKKDILLRESYHILIDYNSN